MKLLKNFISAVILVIFCSVLPAYALDRTGMFGIGVGTFGSGGSASMRYGLRPNIWIEPGIHAAYESVWLQDESKNNFGFGPSLRVNYIFREGERTSLYFIGGIDLDYNDNNWTESGSSSYMVKTKNLSFSIPIGIGIEYLLVKNLSLAISVDCSGINYSHMWLDNQPGQSNFSFNINNFCGNLSLFFYLDSKSKKDVKDEITPAAEKPHIEEKVSN
jgi:hypothetical protein